MVRTLTIKQKKRARRRTRKQKTKKLRRLRSKHYQKGGQPGKGAVVFTLSNAGGFFSTLGSLMASYIYAKSKNYEFFIEHSGWQYTFEKGWHDYFTSLTLFDKTAQFEPLEHHKHLQYPHSDTHTVKRYVETIQEIFKPVQRIQDAADTFIKGIGGDYTSLQVRRGDKHTEMKILPIQEILDNCSIRDDGRRLFVMTDDYTVVEEIQAKLPSCSLHTLCPKTSRGAHHGNILTMSPDQKKAHMDELVASCIAFKAGKEQYSDVRSNVGRFLYLYNYPNVKLYPPHSGKGPDDKIDPVGGL